MASYIPLSGDTFLLFGDTELITLKCNAVLLGLHLIALETIDVKILILYFLSTHIV